ncbi:MAG: hypothetical protein IKY24_02620 [Alistipes sp.]|nr:hypothetical protein [Alistipes sp.]
MKRFLLFVVCVLIGASEIKAAEPVAKTDTLYILGVGNSWTRDSMRWLSAIAKSAGVPVVVGHAYLGGSTLENQYNGIDNLSYTYKHRNIDQVVHSTYQYWLYNCSENPKKTPNKGYRNGLNGIGVTLESVVADKPWEIVVLQPESTARRYNLAKGGTFDLNLLVERIKKMMKPEVADKARFGLMVPFSYPKGNTDYRKHLYTMYNNGVAPASQAEWDALYEKVHHLLQSDTREIGKAMGDNCQFYVNVGLAIYNARQDKHLSQSGYKLQRSQNNTHLSEGLAMYIASLAYAYTLLDIKQEDVKFYPKYSKDVQLTGDRGTTDIITVENTPALAKKARKVAWKACK